jgi:hypothetical protein
MFSMATSELKLLPESVTVLPAEADVGVTWLKIGDRTAKASNVTVPEFGCSTTDALIITLPGELPSKTSTSLDPVESDTVVVGPTRVASPCTIDQRTVIDSWGEPESAALTITRNEFLS